VPNPAVVILSTLDRHLIKPATIRLMGGAALVLGYGRERATEDADLLMAEEELEVLADEVGFGAALENTNRELEPMGLYISHIWGPEQQILTPEWREGCRAIARHPDWRRLHVHVLGPLDLIVGKLARADEEDLEDIEFLMQRENLSVKAVLQAADRAMVPSILRDVFTDSRARLEAHVTATPT
jgi:hypothetical protein